MKITEEYTNSNTEVIAIKSAEYIGDYSIRISFSDGFCRLMNFKPFLDKALHPSIRKYLDESIFKDYQIVDGNLNWNDYDLIFPIEDIYDGKL